MAVLKQRASRRVVLDPIHLANILASIRAELNVTPLIDVPQVLMITFMIILPSLSHGLDALVPQPPDQKASSPRDDVVLTVLRNGMIRLNQARDPRRLGSTVEGSIQECCPSRHLPAR